MLETSRANHPFRTLTILILTLTTGLTLLPPANAQTGPAIVSVWSDTYQTNNIDEPNLTPGTSFTIEIIVDNAPSFNGYELFLYYDPNYVTATSVDVTTGTVFNRPFPISEDTGTAGQVQLATVNLGSAFAGISGTLAHINFQVTGLGASPLTLAAGLEQPSTFAQTWTRLVLGTTAIDTTTIDGYFKNVTDNQGPIARFTITPTSPQTGDSIVFDATQSYDPDNNVQPDRGISNYVWDFGHGFGITTIFPVIIHRFSENIGGGNRFDFDGNFSVRLTVTDKNDNLQGMIATRVEVETAEPPTATFQIFAASTPLITAPGDSLDTTIILASVGDFVGTISLTAVTLPTVPNAPAATLDPSTIDIGGGGVGTTTHAILVAASRLTISTRTNTPPGRYAIIIRGTSDQLTELAQVNILVRALEPVFVRGKVTWTRNLSLSANSNTQTWISKVHNPNPNINLLIHVQAIGNSNSSPTFIADSGPILLRGGETRFDIVTRQTFSISDIGSRILFVAVIVWQDPVSSQLLASSTVKTGSFTIVP